MANSNTEYSKKLRLETSKKWNKENTKRMMVNFNLNNKTDIEILKLLDVMEGSQIGKFRKVFRFYIEKNK